MGVQALFEIFKDRRTPAQRFRDRVVGVAISAAVLFLLGAGIYQVYHWIF
jgi:hypothetical protein